jgi:hypothetical protein
MIALSDKEWAEVIKILDGLGITLDDCLQDKNLEALLLQIINSLGGN